MFIVTAGRTLMAREGTRGLLFLPRRVLPIPSCEITERLMAGVKVW